MRKYIDAVEVRISVLDRILSGALTNADFIQRIAPDLAIGGLNGLYNDMCNELADNLCGATYESKKEIADNYATDIHPLLRGYYNRLTELADRVRGLGVAESAVEDIIKVAWQVMDNTERLGDFHIVVERYYTPKDRPQQREAGKLPIIPTSEQINEFKGYFVAKFVGMGNNQDKFTDYVIPALKRQRTLKDMAAFALALYNSAELINSKRPNAFAKWLGAISCIFNIPQMIEYKPNKLPQPDYDITYHYLTPRAAKWLKKTASNNV